MKIIQKIGEERSKIFTLLDQVIVSGVNFLLGVLLARLLGLEIFGGYSFALLILYFFSGLHQALIVAPLYSLLSSQNDKSSFISNLNGINFLFSLFAALLTIFCTYYSVEYIGISMDFENVVTISFWVFSFIIFDFIRRYNFALGRPFISLSLDIIAFGLQPIILIICYYTNSLSLEIVFLFQGILWTIASIVAIVFSFSPSFKFDQFKTVFKTVLNYSKYLIGTALLQFFSGNIFLGAASIILGPSALGIIRMAQNLIGVLNVLFLALENIIPIKAAKVLAKDGKKEMIKYFKKTGLQGLVATSLIILFIVLFRNSLIDGLYGSEYLKHSWTILSFGILYIMVFIGTMVRFIIRTTSQNHIILIGYIVSGLVSILIAKPLVENFSLIGVIIGLFLSQIITLSIYITHLKTSLKCQEK